MSSLRQVIVATSLLSGVVFLSGKPRIHYVEPLALLVGGTTEVTIHGDSLRDGDQAPSIWTNFDSEWIVLQDEKSNPRKVRFQVSLPPGSTSGAGVIRVWTPKGTSVPFVILKDRFPDSVTFRFKDNAPVIHKFNAKLGQMFSCEVWGNRLNQKVDPVMSLRDPNGKFIQQVDDDPVNGADPMLVFKAEADGEYELSVHDLHWSGGPFGVLRARELASQAITTAKGLHHTTTEPKKFPVAVKKGEFLTIKPQTQALGSPAMLLMELKESGRQLSKSGRGDVLDEPLRYKASNDAECELVIYDLLGREGLPFTFEISRETAPFIVQQRGNDCHNLAPGQELKLDFRVVRFNYNGPISIHCEDLEAIGKTEIPEKKNDAKLSFRVPECADPKTLLVIRFLARAEVNGRTYEETVRTDEQLNKTPRHFLDWPAGVSGSNFVTVLKGKD
ncbi:MAG: hypothetical protein VXB01_12330 [Opitutae bacterium]